MFALPFTHFPLLISFISLVATLPVADNLFTDWTPSDLNDFSTSDSSSQFVAGDSNTDQLLAFNNDPSPNLFTSDSSTSDPLNQASADTSLLDTSNMFLDSTPLDSLDTTSFIPPVFDEQALPVLPSDLFSSDAISPDLLADNPSGGCSPPSSSRKSRKRESAGAACPSPDQENSYGAREEIDQAKKGFFDKSGAAQSEAYKQIVCPSAHFGAAVSIPVCSSPDPTMNSLMGQLSPTYPGSETLADSTLCQSPTLCSFLSHHNGRLIKSFINL